MKVINIDKVNEKIYYEKLKNGLDVYLYPKEGIYNNYVTLTTRYGSINNEFIPYNKNKMTRFPNGIAHFLEHKLFAQENGMDPSQFFAQSGTNYNAKTSYKFTSYEFEGPNNLEENICFLLDYVQAPYFTDDNVNSEKGIIIEEINMCKDNPTDVLYDKVRYNSFYNNPIKESIIGEVSDIKKITKELLYDCYYTFYNPSNMFMVITGNFELDKILKLIEDNQNKKSFKEQKNIKIKEYDEPNKIIKQKEIINIDTDIPKLIYSIKIPTKGLSNCIKRELFLYIYTVFNILFDDTSELSERLKKNNIIVGNIFIDVLDCNDHIFVSLFNETKNYQKLIEEIDESLKNIKIDEKDMIRKKKTYISNELFAYDNIVSINDIITDSIIFENKVEEKIFSIFENLNIKEMMNIVKKLDLSNKSVVIVEKK